MNPMSSVLLTDTYLHITYFIYIYISHKYYVIPRKSHHCNSKLDVKAVLPI